MNKAELIEKVTALTEANKRDAEAIVDATFEVIASTVAAGETVKISGFGIFEKKERASRVGTNPSNQEKIEIPASNTISFKVSKTLKAKLN